MGEGLLTGAGAEERQLRTEPVQARSAARLSALLDAAAQVVQDHGCERLTTALVAERAAASIGTVYRYFPDRVAVLEELGARCYRRFIERLDRALAAVEGESVMTRIDAAVDAYSAMFRDEPGFRAVRFVDLAEGRPTAPGLAARMNLARILAGRHHDERTGDDEYMLRLETAVTIAEALVHRAYLFAPEGEHRFVAEAKRVCSAYLGNGYRGGAPAPASGGAAES